MRRRIHIFRCTLRQRERERRELERERETEREIERRRVSKIGVEEIVVGKEKGRRRDRKESGARAEIKDDDGGKTGMGAVAGEYRAGDGKSRGSARKSLRLAKLRNMETPEPISRNRAADIGGWGAGGRSEGGGGICKYFSNPRGKPRLPFPPLSFFLSLLARRHRAYRSRRSLFPLARRFFLLLSIARFSRRFFSRSISFSRSTRAKKKRKREERKNENEGESR